MPHFICVTCGMQFCETDAPPASCPVCTDDRQFVGWEGQSWTTLEKLRETHRLTFADEDEGVIGIAIEPHFGIGQRALFVRTPHGNVLWDCVGLVNEEAVQRITTAGGLKAIAISHPHYYTVMVEWSQAFGRVPIYLHEDDREWVMREHKAIVHWKGDDREIAPGLTLIRCAGHFPGATVMHWAQGAKGEGAVFAGDVIAVNLDRTSVSFMHSFPNYIPLDAAAVRHIGDVMAPYRFAKIYGAFSRRNVMADGRAVFERSITRYLKAIGVNVFSAHSRESGNPG